MLAPPEDGKKYQIKMSLIFTGLLFGVPLILFALLLALGWLFNPFGLP